MHRFFLYVIQNKMGAPVCTDIRYHRRPQVNHFLDPRLFKMLEEDMRRTAASPEMQELLKKREEARRA